MRLPPALQFFFLSASGPQLISAAAAAHDNQLLARNGGPRSSRQEKNQMKVWGEEEGLLSRIEKREPSR